MKLCKSVVVFTYNWSSVMVHNLRSSHASSVLLGKTLWSRPDGFNVLRNQDTVIRTPTNQPTNHIPNNQHSNNQPQTLLFAKIPLILTIEERYCLRGIRFTYVVRLLSFKKLTIFAYGCFISKQMECCQS